MGAKVLCHLLTFVRSLDHGEPSFDALSCRRRIGLIHVVLQLTNLCTVHHDHQTTTVRATFSVIDRYRCPE
eukprot:714220-Amphidinium_carterae.2